MFHEGKIIREGTPADLGLSRGLPRIKWAGEGFNLVILQLLIAEPEVKRAEIRDGNLLINLNAGMDMSYLTNLIEEAGGKIYSVSREDNVGDILTRLIENEHETKLYK